jgi:hypothetical protein
MNGTGEHHLKQSHSGSKITCSPLYADYRSKTNAEILMDMGHMGDHAQEEQGEGRKPKL